MPAGIGRGTGNEKDPGKARAKKESKHRINQPTNDKVTNKKKREDNKINKKITHEEPHGQKPRRRWGVRPCARAQLGAKNEVYFHKQTENQGQWKQQEGTRKGSLEQ